MGNVNWTSAQQLKSIALLWVVTVMHCLLPQSGYLDTLNGCGRHTLLGLVINYRVPDGWVCCIAPQSICIHHLLPIPLKFSSFVTERIPSGLKVDCSLGRWNSNHLLPSGTDEHLAEDLCDLKQFLIAVSEGLVIQSLSNLERQVAYLGPTNAIPMGRPPSLAKPGKLIMGTCRPVHIAT